MAEVLETVGSAALFLFPSEWYEGQPKVILEAFAKGTPVLASRRGSMEEMIDEGLNGMLFEPGNPDDLAAKVSRLTADPAVSDLDGEPDVPTSRSIRHGA